MDYLKADRESLRKELSQLQASYSAEKAKGLKLDMSRGKPGADQLDLSLGMLDIKEWKSDSGIDTRNYSNLEGIPEARKLMGDILGLNANEVIVGGSSSLSLMYLVIQIACNFGLWDSEKPWNQCEGKKFICPVPGYDRHFRITEFFGFELVTVDMTENGPNMDQVEALVKNDPAIKGIWIVPKYSNPQGVTCGADTVRRLAEMKTAAADFKIFWDNAYVVHHVSDTPDELMNLMEVCRVAGCENRVVEFCSTSKVTFPGAGISAVGACEAGVKYLLKHFNVSAVCFDKMNQLRHVKFLKDLDGIASLMEKHKALIGPKFRMVDSCLREGLNDCGAIGQWHVPNGGYFICLKTLPGCAKRVVALCAEAGVKLTEAGATHPKGIDPEDAYIRIAPTFPTLGEIESAAKLLALCVRIASLEKLLG